jgi:hypothetical protein
MRSLNSDGKSKKRKGCLLTEGSTSSVSSSDAGDGGRGGAAGGGCEAAFALTPDAFALEAMDLDLRGFGIAHVVDVPNEVLL